MTKSFKFFIVFSLLFFNYQLEISYPLYFPAPYYNFNNNPLKKEIILLGRTLFYEPKLSINNQISCSSCHSSYSSFAHTDHPLSHGVYDSIGTRNAPALFNLAWQKTFMWDGAINHLDMQALAPIHHEDEMAEDIKKVVEKLSKSNLYKNLFYKAFEDSIISGEKILKALAQFQLTIISDNAKYDKVMRGEKTFTSQEKNGYILFKTHCNICHKEPLFSTYKFAKNGLKIDTTLLDYGKGKVTKQKKDSLSFKIPSLRNVSFTYPYMHDGRFNTLSQVINHYTHLNTSNTNLSIPLLDSIHLSSNETKDLIAFLLTLNDTAFLFDEKYQYPRDIFLRK